MEFKYDFTDVGFIQAREGSHTNAVDRIPIPGASIKEGFSKIPMWVADMNFPTCPAIPEAIIERAKQPHYGYFYQPQEFYDGIIKWQETRHGVTGLTKEGIGYENGVLGGVVSALNIFCQKGDNVLLHSPTYIGFTGCITNNGYKIVHSPLYRDAEGVWRMDYEDMEKKIVDNHIHATVFCNPHNPSGRVWTKEELEKAYEIFKKHDVMVVADEIWADMILRGHTFQSTAMTNEDAKMRTITISAPSKTFNLAGLVGSYRMVYNPKLIDQMNKETSLSHYDSMNVLWMAAQIAAYGPEGYRWTDELCEVLSDNVDYAYDYITKHFEGVKLAKPEGTYLLYLDCTEWCEKHNITIDELQRKGVEVGVVWQDGRPFHGPNSIRINLAVPTELVKEAMDRLDKYVFNA